jgi:hypothetical protein
MAVFLVAALCILVEVYRRFRRSKHLDKLLPDYTANNPEDSHLHTRRREDLKYHKL